MIRERFSGIASWQQPFVTARVVIPSQNVVGDVPFLVDTGADSSVLAAADVVALGVDPS
jgi:predicted aspartyl protease